MSGWRVETAPYAIQRNSRIRRVTAFTWRRNLTPFCIESLLFKHTCGKCFRPVTPPESISSILPLTLVVRICVVLFLLLRPLAAQTDPAILLIRIVEGAGTVYP